MVGDGYAGNPAALRGKFTLVTKPGGRRQSFDGAQEDLFISTKKVWIPFLHRLVVGWLAPNLC
jgi:hypothetical protein